MKKFKKITSVLLCVLLAMTLLGSTLVSAKAKPVYLDVVYNNKTIRLIRDVDQRENTPVLKDVLKRWGKNYKYENGVYWHNYTYKRGKSSVMVSDNDTKKGRIGAVRIDVKDKNIAVAGVKVGASKSIALKKLKAIYGSKVSYSNGTIYVDMVNYMPMSFKIKNNKVVSISWFRS